VTFSPKFRAIHRVALKANKCLEKYLRQRPLIKNLLVDAYKSVNERNEGYSCMSDSIREKLREYYKSSNDALLTLLDGATEVPWI
jgi:hypothetical protein